MYRCSCGATFQSEQAYTIHRVFCKAKWLAAILALILVALPSLAHASTVPLPIHALVRDRANQPMSNIMVDVMIVGQNISAAYTVQTDDAGEVLLLAEPGDNVTVRAGSDCHRTTKTVTLTDDPYIVVKPICALMLPVIHVAPEVGGATRFWGG